MRTDFVVYGPNHWYYLNNFYSDTKFEYDFDLNDSDDKIAFGYQMGKDAVISSYGMYIINIEGSCPSYLTGITTITGAIGDYKSGYPSDDLYNNAVWEDYDPITLGSGWSWIDFETPINVNRGDFICLQVKPNLANPPNSVDFVGINNGSTMRTQNPGFWVYNTSWYRYTWIGPAAIKFTDATVLGWPVVQPVWEEFSFPAEWGLEFKIPLQAKCIGGILSIYASDYDVPFNLILTDSNDVELASLSGTFDDVGYPTGGVYTYVTWNSETDPILAADTTYRLYLKPLTSNVLNKHGFIFADEASKQVMPGGTDWKMIERDTPASGWSYVEAGYPWISLLLTDFQVGSGDTSDDGGAFGFIG